MAAHRWMSLGRFDVHELDFASLGSWSFRRKAGMAITLVGLLSGLGYLLLLQLPMTQLEQQRGAEATLKAELESRAVQAASLEADMRQMHVLEASFRTLLEQLPSQAEVPALLEEVARLGQSSGLIIEHIQWLPEVPQPVYAELPLHMTLVGGYHDLGLFVSGMASLPRIITLHDFALVPTSKAGDGPLRMTLLAKTYRAHDQGVIP